VRRSVSTKQPPPALAVSLGDPAGIGPQVSEAALAALWQQHPGELAGGAHLFGPANLVEPMVQRLSVAGLPPELLEAHPQADLTGPTGVATAAGGTAALAACTAAMHFVDDPAKPGPRALVTAPINKLALHLAGSPARGHTELLAARLADGPVAMAFFSEPLNVVLATVHIPLCQVPAALTPQSIVNAARLMDAGMRPRLGGRRPRLGLAGLNPHAGEAGLLGSEEVDVLEVARQQCLAAGIDLSGPVAPDAVFGRAVAGDFDAVVAMYHDQGLIPVKLLAFGSAVNATLGLRVVRTSPDHGTAFDRVHTNQVRHDGMLAALRWAVRLSADAPRNCS
jgi:4-hydroxythreonine-4-phosphate dehydrogenase